MSTFHTRHYAISTPTDERGMPRKRWAWKLYSTEQAAVDALTKAGGGVVTKVFLEEHRVLMHMRELVAEALAPSPVETVPEEMIAKLLDDLGPVAKRRKKRPSRRRRDGR